MLNWKTDNIMSKNLLEVYGKEAWYKGNTSCKAVSDPENWEECSKCGLKPIRWTWDNGDMAFCGCERVVGVEPIGDYVRRTKGSLVGYDRDSLKKEWNRVNK